MCFLNASWYKAGRNAFSNDSFKGRIFKQLHLILVDAVFLVFAFCILLHARGEDSEVWNLKGEAYAFTEGGNLWGFQAPWPYKARKETDTYPRWSKRSSLLP